MEKSSKLNVFLEVAAGLNKTFGATPVLYGSLGPYKIIGGMEKA